MERERKIQKVNRHRERERERLMYKNETRDDIENNILIVTKKTLLKYKTTLKTSAPRSERMLL